MTQLTSKQLQAGITALANDVVNAVIHWKLSKGIHEAAEKWPLVIQQSNTFWTLTIKAHVNVSVLAMCRVFDQESNSLHLLGLLRLIKQNLSLFDQIQFRDRLRDNPFVESLAESVVHPVAPQLEADIALCSIDDPLVKRLLIYRHTTLAHQSRKRRLNSMPTRSDEEITDEDFEILLGRASQILNRYSGLFCAEYFTTQVVGHKDHEIIFRWIQERVELERGILK